jgi:hypothetical protein
MVLRTEIEKWLLEENNPGVHLRVMVELCGNGVSKKDVKAARNSVIKTLPAARDFSWVKGKGKWLTLNLTALAESGLSRKDIKVDPVVGKLLNLPFDAGCGDMMLLRALVMLGYGNDPRVKKMLKQVEETQLKDGGWFCLHRLNKMNKLPKSCIKAAMHGLLLGAELKKQGISFKWGESLAHYFIKRKVFYRTDEPGRLVLNKHPGWRMVDVFFPAETQRVGLPLLLYGLAVLGVGKNKALNEAWDLLESKKDKQGRIMLEGTLVKSYLPKELVGKPSKWATLYACLAWKYK